MLIRKVNEIEERTKEGDFRWQPGIRGGLLGEMTVGLLVQVILVESQQNYLKVLVLK